MIGTFVTFRYGNDFEDAAIRKIADAAKPAFEGMPGLRSKAFTLDAANIFPGDTLLKNFGVTRHGRVVFYDYDELCLLTDCHFRKLPEARTPEDEIAAEPWFSVRENDIFPEE